MTTRSAVLEVMIRAALRAGERLRHDLERRGSLDVREKGASDFVSDADLGAQAIIRAELSVEYPDHALMLEEADGAPSVRGVSRFIVDPLDGTTNFLHGIPHFAVSIALEVGDVIVAGTVVDPVKNEVFWAERGRGAWLGERKLVVSAERDLARCVVGTGIPHNGRSSDHEAYLQALASVMRDVAGIRRLGSAALDLAYVAAGRFEAFFETGLAAWDVAAGALLVREAGGIVTRTDGVVEHLSGDVLASASRSLHDDMLHRIAAIHGTAAARG